MDRYMEIALLEAEKAFKNGDIPVGAIIVKDGVLIAKAHNNRHIKNNVIGHAEILAILKAQKKVKNWRLYNCDMYVTLKPCVMCELIIKEARLMNVYYLTEKTENKNNYQKTTFKLVDNKECRETEKYKELLTVFFEDKR